MYTEESTASLPRQCTALLSSFCGSLSRLALWCRTCCSGFLPMPPRWQQSLPCPATMQMHKGASALQLLHHKGYWESPFISSKHCPHVSKFTFQLLVVPQVFMKRYYIATISFHEQKECGVHFMAVSPKVWVGTHQCVVSWFLVGRKTFWNIKKTLQTLLPSL